MRIGMEQKSARLLRQDLRDDLVIGKPVWEPDGRKIGTLRALSGPEPAGTAYAIVCLGSYPKVGAGCRAIPNDLLIFDAERGGFTSRVSEIALRSSPAYSGAPDFLDERWRTRLREHYQRIAANPSAVEEPERLAG